MSLTHSPETARRLPTIREAAIFRVKSLGLQSKRILSDTIIRRVNRHHKGEGLIERTEIAESKSKLWTEIEPEERFLVAGKIRNFPRCDRFARRA